LAIKLLTPLSQSVPREWRYVFILLFMTMQCPRAGRVEQPSEKAGTGALLSVLQVLQTLQTLDGFARPISVLSSRDGEPRQSEMTMLKNKKLAVLGAGKLGETLIKGLIEAGVTTAASVTVTAAHQERLDQVRERFGVSC